jgi:hypothetical protein
MVDSHHSAADDFGERLERHYERVVGQATFRTDAVAAEVRWMTKSASA